MRSKTSICSSGDSRAYSRSRCHSTIVTQCNNRGRQFMEPGCSHITAIHPKFHAARTLGLHTRPVAKEKFFLGSLTRDTYLCRKLQTPDLTLSPHPHMHTRQRPSVQARLVLVHVPQAHSSTPQTRMPSKISFSKIAAPSLIVRSASLRR